VAQNMLALRPLRQSVNTQLALLLLTLLLFLIIIIEPYGTVAPENYTVWTTDTAIQNAALMIAVDIWQARTATLSGSNLVDFQPSPYRMSAQLLAKVRGLIAHALDPRSMVG
jgi:hypothetical protein